MPLVPSDFPQRLAAMGVPVNVMSDWATAGGSANHTAVVMHHTASSASTSPDSDAAYCAHGSSDSPLYNVLVDRYGAAWVLARDKANSSGKISGTALNEVKRGEANLTPAGQRGLGDTTSDNASLFAVSAQSDGTGEVWSPALINAMAVTCACALQCLGLPHASFVTHHAALTSRKIDLTMGAHGCPSMSAWPQLINDAMSGARPIAEVPDMWQLNGKVMPGDELVLPLPASRKASTTVVTAYLNSGDPDGAALWGAAGCPNAAVGAWDRGNTWELWLPPAYPVTDNVRDDACTLTFVNNGPTGPVTVSVSGQ